MSNEALRAYPSIRQSLAIAGIVILMSVACSPMVMLRAWIGQEAAFLAYYSLAFGLSFYIVHTTRRRKQGFSTYNFRIGSWRLVPPIALGTVGLLVGVAAPVGELIPMPEFVKKSMQEMVGSTGFPTFLYFVIFAPLLEELIFRGIMLDGLLRRYRPPAAILVSSFLFGFVHLNPWQFVTGLVLGCFFGWVYYRTGSVGCCVLGHMSANGSGYVLRLVMQFAPKVAGGDGGFDASAPGVVSRVIIVSGCLAMSILAAYLLRREFTKHQYIAVEPLPATELPVTAGDSCIGITQADAIAPVLACQEAPDHK